MDHIRLCWDHLEVVPEELHRVYAKELVIDITKPDDCEFCQMLVLS
jgi:hypothetical protein